MDRRVVARATQPPPRLAILGHPVAHSLSPAMHNAALAHFGFAPRYECIDVHPDHLRGWLPEFAAQRLAGNVTIPHKEAVARAADCTSLALRVGAVNTFWHEDGRLVGHNTDVAGVVATIQGLCPSGVSTLRCAILGAGGAAAAVLVALEALGCTDVCIASRTTARAERLVDRIGMTVHIAPSAERAAQGAGLVINATPLGLHQGQRPVALEALESSAIVFDLVYQTGETAWVRECRALGHLAVDGLPMLVEQGVAAFECWFGVRPPHEVLSNGLRAASADR